MSPSHTELAARLRLLADWIDESVWSEPELNDAPKTIHEAAAALESPTPPERVQPMRDALESIREHCKAQPSALAKAIVATCDSALADTPPAAPAQDARPPSYVLEPETVAELEAIIATPQAATAGAREAFDIALRQTWGMVDPLRPPAPGSYYLGEHNGIIAALKTIRENFDAALRASTPEAVPPGYPSLLYVVDQLRLHGNVADEEGEMTESLGDLAKWIEARGIVTKESGT